jgi:hypothetical protein
VVVVMIHGMQQQLHWSRHYKGEHQQELKVLREIGVHKVLKELKVLRVHKAHKEIGVHKGHKDHKEHKVR